MTNLIKAEFHKLKKSKVFYAMVALMVIQTIAGPILDTRLISKSGKDMLVFILIQQQCLTLMIVIGIFSYFAGIEFNSGYIKNLISYGHKRINILISKSIAFYVGVLVIAFIFPICLSIINTAKNGYGEAFTLSSFLFLLRVLFLKTLIYVAMASIAILFTFVFKNAFAAMGAYYVFDGINRFFTALAFKNESIRVIFEKTVFAQPQFALMEDITLSQGLQVAIISLGTILVSTLISLYFFKRADIK